VSSPEVTVRRGASARFAAIRRTALAYPRIAPRGIVTPGPLLRAMRPRQWSKNALVVAAPCAAGVITRPEIGLRVALAFAVFCLLASSTYLVNDLRDAEEDRLHPRKRRRPIASGELSSRTALIVSGLMALVALALAWVTAPLLVAVGAAYLAITAGYSLWWRRIVALDILAIASGFVLRAIAGGAAGHLHLSRSFLVVAGCGAVFLVAGKRYAELREGVAPSRTRATLRSYSPGALRFVLVFFAVLATAAYGVWALAGPGHGLWHILSIVPLSLGLVRYGVLVAHGAGESPEETIAGDRTLLALGVLWTSLFLAGVYAGH